jgi:hypothetical protein
MTSIRIFDEPLVPIGSRKPGVVFKPSYNYKRELEDILKRFGEQYGRKIVYATSDDMFYEIVNGVSQPVRIGPERPERLVQNDPRHVVTNLDDLGAYTPPDNPLTNREYEQCLSESDNKLRIIIIHHVAEATRTELINESVGMPPRGSCHTHWQRMKEDLGKKYGILWASPPDENPGTLYD